MNRHVEALAEEFLGRGHDVRVLAPVDPPGRLSRALHRAAAEPRELPDYLMPLGRTVGLRRQRRGLQPRALPGRRRRRAAARAAQPATSTSSTCTSRSSRWSAGTRPSARSARWSAPSTPTRPRRCPTTSPTALGARRVFNRLSARIAVSEAAAWTGRRWFGGEYEIIPNGVDVDAAPSGPKPPGEELRILFVGRPEERKGLPILLTAFSALVEHVPCRLTVIGAEREDVLRYLADPELMRSIDVRGRVSGEELWRELHDADVLCAPSLSGESFGMVLTEAFAAGTPVIASAHRRLQRRRQRRRRRRPGPARRPAAPRRGAAARPPRARAPAEMGEAARRSAQRYAWPRVADQVTEVYERAIEAPAPVTAGERIAHWAGLRPADGGPPAPRRAAALARSAAGAGGQAGARGSRAASGSPSPASSGVGLTALAAQKIGVDNVVESIVRSEPHLGPDRLRADGDLPLLPRRLLVLDRRARRCPTGPIRRRDVTSATMIGVLMSATLPARLGEPARALTLARRTGRMRETFPVLLGTLVSQTMLNLVALVLLGVIIVSTTPSSTPAPSRSSPSAWCRCCSCWSSCCRAGADAAQRQRPPGPARRGGPPGPGAGARRPRRLPRPAPRHCRRRGPARRLGDPARRLLGAALRARPRRQGRDRRRRRGALRGQRHRGRAGDAVQHRRLPAAR